MKLTRHDLVNRMAEKTGCGKNEADRFVRLFMEEVKAALADDDTVELRGFGSFSVARKGERQYINPLTKERHRSDAHGSPSLLRYASCFACRPPFGIPAYGEKREVVPGIHNFFFLFSRPAKEFREMVRGLKE